MNDDVSGALRGFADAQARADREAAPDLAAEVSGLTRRVARRRAVRTGSGVLGGGFAIGAVVVGAYLTGGSTPPPAIPVPTTTSTPTPSTTPTPSSTPTTPAPSPTPDETPASFRDAPPMTPGMLESAGPGWRLVTYGARAEDESVVDPTTLYLLDPDGRPYVVPAATDPAGWYLLDWLPGTATVLVQDVENGADQVVDVLTGESGATLGFWGEAEFADDGTGDVLLATDAGAGDPGMVVLRRVTADGVPVQETAPFTVQYASAGWLQNGSQVVLNDVAGPRLVTLAGLSPAALRSPYPDGPDACRAWSWVGEDLLLQCAAGGTGAFAVGWPSEFWLVPAGAGEPWRLVGMPDATRVGGVWRVGDRLIAGTLGVTEAEAGWYEVDADGVRPLSAGGPSDLGVYGVQGSELLATLRPLVVGPSTSALIAVDPATGIQRTLVTGSPASFTSLGVTPALTGPPQTDTGD